jgi:hypothetical protein
MLTARAVGAMVAGVGLMLASALVSGAAGVPAVGGPAASSQSVAPWAGQLAAMDQALRVGAVAATPGHRAQIAALIADRPITIPADI